MTAAEEEEEDDDDDDDDDDVTPDAADTLPLLLLLGLPVSPCSRSFSLRRARR